MSTMRIWDRLGFRQKVLFAMSAVVIPIILIMAIYSYLHSKTLYENQMETELALENELVSEKVFSLFFGKGEAVKQIAELESMKRFVESNPTRENVKENQDYEIFERLLTRMQEEEKGLEFLWLVFLKNDFYMADHGIISNDDFHVNTRPWLEKAVSTSGISFSDLYKDFETGISTVSVIYPIERDGRRLGYLGADMHLDVIPNLIKPFETNGKHHILLSSRGEVLFDSEGKWPLFEKYNLMTNDSKLLDAGEENYYVEIRHVKDTGWRLVSYADESIVIKPLSSYLTGVSLAWTIAGLLILFCLSLLLQSMLKDVSTIVKHVNDMKQGNLITYMNLNRTDEVGEIAASIEEMGSRLHYKIQEMNHQAKYDQLTNLPNRLSIENLLKKWISTDYNGDEIVAVTFMDLDDFKQINDSKGHAYGDSLLIQVAERIHGLLPKDSYFGRFGGDEFIILLRAKKKDFLHIRSTLQEVHNAFLNPFKLNNLDLFVTSSLGVSLFPKDASSREQLLANADTALYKAKDLGRNRIEFFNFEMKEEFEKRLMMEQGLREAIIHGQFTLHYQPQIKVATGKTESLEALIRWQHPEWGMISPAEFIPIAESTGRIQEIGDWVMETAIKEIGELSKEFPDVERLAINVSALQLHEPLFLMRLKELLSMYDVSPTLLELEITESLLIDGGDEVVTKLNELQKMGIAIALDDFGTGYSSLNYLCLLPINRVKLDKSFISKVEEDERLVAVVRSIIDLSHRLGFDIVAEGVETSKQLHLLTGWQVDTIQGYYFSRPLNSTALQEFLRKESNPS
ncbi:MAG: EAL domain-containing protein [Paenisporosarcina sp.]